jgi:uncharacterized protein
VTPVEILAVILAGAAAGAINTIVGSGTLITFPTLLAIGLTPLVANVTNTLGLIAGSVSGAIGYRRELSGQRDRVVRVSIAAGLGGLTGAVLLLLFPNAFSFVVPWLILLAVVLVAVQPTLARRMAQRRARRPADAPPPSEHPLPLLVGMYLTGIYGGYFGAAQGVIMIALLGVFLSDSLQRLNGVKNVAAAVANAVAAVLFVFLAPIRWDVAILLAIGSMAGGQVGAYVGRRLSPMVLRGAIIVVGSFVAARLLLA